MAVPNTYFGGDVSVAGLLTGQDLLAMKDKIVGDFVIIPKVTIKSDEPIFLDGMTYDELKAAVCRAGLRPRYRRSHLFLSK